VSSDYIANLIQELKADGLTITPERELMLRDCNDERSARELAIQWLCDALAMMREKELT